MVGSKQCASFSANFLLNSENDLNLDIKNGSTLVKLKCWSMLVYFRAYRSASIPIKLNCYFNALVINLDIPLHIRQNQRRHHRHISWPQGMDCEKDYKTICTLQSSLDVYFFSLCLIFFTRNWSAGWGGWISTIQGTRLNCRNKANP